MAYTRYTWVILIIAAFDEQIEAINRVLGIGLDGCKLECRTQTLLELGVPSDGTPLEDKDCKLPSRGERNAIYAGTLNQCHRKLPNVACLVRGEDFFRPL